ncbi:MAG: AAA family ATPase [Acidimicrobiales bacterium]
MPPERFKLWTPQDLLDNNVPPVWTIKRLVISPTYGMLAGPEKALKSYIAQFIAVGAAGGVPVLGHFEVPEAVAVLMFVGEGGRLPYTRRLKRIAAAYGVNLADLPLFTSFDVASTQSDVFQHGFVQHLKDHRPAITIIEPYYAFHGTASEGKMLYEEGDQLVWLSHTAEEYGSSLIIGNHYNQTGSGSGLRRITGAGPAEWSDSWWIVEKDENRSDVTTGHFELAFEVGSRQWGATNWDLTVDLGPFDDDTMDNEGDIAWMVKRSSGKRSGSSGTADFILNLVTQHPFEFTKTQIVNACGGKKAAAGDDFRAMGLTGKIEMHTVKRQEGSRQVTREVWGPRTTPLASVTPLYPASVSSATPAWND